ncbi:MGT family glycosyltransferase [Spinactinospora alkalitolerans]|uniref:MGT family glycosyltransferase n=1 Tax=Spinactinospora alkalitolerans TaxID=687207 RepID=A0A852TN73_9ACTN|nr:macrolide family glycosyltransferase [Spinactinospora alkalitolerans]NYE45388.1 MGT family glycosyltransferase [Spinactinospora alkalitolerans]
MALYAMLPSPMTGHVNPTLPIAGELVRRGHEVVYDLPSDYREAVRSVGARLRPITLAEPDGYKSEPDPVARFARVPLWLAGEAEHVLPQVCERIGAAPPDVLVYDMTCVWGRVLARAHRPPAAMIVGSYVGNEHFSPMRTEHYAAMRDVLDAGFAGIAQVIDRLNTAYGVRLSPRELFARDERLVLVVMPREFHPAGATFNGPFRFIGSAVPAEATAGRSLAAPSSPRRPKTVYLSPGTVVDLWPDMVDTVRRAFGDGAWRVMMSLGGRRPPAGLPDWMHAAPSLPQLRVLAGADAFVTHGGTNSVTESLHFGVPMVVMASAPEHAITADRVEELGLGVRIRPGEADAERLRAAVEAVSSRHDIRSALDTMRERTRGAGGPAAAADALERLLEEDASATCAERAVGDGR